MKISSLLTLCFLILATTITNAQDEEPRVIKVKKEFNLAKVVLDNTEGKLIVMDRFGNPKENRILSYKLYVKGKKSTEEFQGHSNRLNQEMISHLNKQSQSSKLFFTEIAVEDDNGHIVRLPDLIETWFPDCKNCDRKSPRR